ncbi:hypothetical protein AB0D86_27200 [Streptomyces sp. NPDC048324]|uniref:hypothetical protein n=1 Tax=Streptomyces sp. NPDC048324 TaxID=3157205 RepID=UPI0034384A33
MGDLGGGRGRDFANSQGRRRRPDDIMGRCRHDEYDIVEYGDRTPPQVDADVVSEALRLAQYPRFPIETADAPT